MSSEFFKTSFSKIPCNSKHTSGIYLVFSGAENQPNSQLNSGDFFPNFKKIPNCNLQKIIIVFLKIGIFIQSTHTQATWRYSTTIASYFSFNLMAIVCVIANLFLIDQKCHNCVQNKFPNLRVYHAHFPNLKGPRAPSQNCKKIPAHFFGLSCKTSLLTLQA